MKIYNSKQRNIVPILKEIPTAILSNLIRGNISTERYDKHI